MSKFYLMMLRDKEANGAGYAIPPALVSKNLDPDLYASLEACPASTGIGYSSIEEAENAAMDIAKKVFIYDHTKRPKVLKDFRLYRWWILDASKPVSYTSAWSEEENRSVLIFKTLEEVFKINNSPWCWGTKDAIVKKGKMDFSKEADPSKGTIAKRAEETQAKANEDLKAFLNDPRRQLDTYVDNPNEDEQTRLCSLKIALDKIPYMSRYVEGFHKDSLNLPDEFCFVYPTKGCYYSQFAADVIGADPKSRKKIWACAVSRCTYKKESKWKTYCSELYSSSIRVFSTKEEAMLHAGILGFPHPQVFEDFKLPEYVTKLLGYIENIGGCYARPSEVYRLLVIEGLVKPIEKFSKG